MATKDIYNKEFYDSQSARSYISAKEIIKILTNKVGTFNSVIDIGCGIGTWLKAFKENSIEGGGVA